MKCPKCNSEEYVSNVEIEHKPETNHYICCKCKWRSKDETKQDVNKNPQTKIR